MWVLAALFVGAVIGVNYLEKHKKQNTDENMPQAKKDIYEDPMAVQLAEACKCGDASAMYKMAELLYKHCEAQMKKLLEQYEAAPTPKHASEVREKNHMGEAYMM